VKGKEPEAPPMIPLEPISQPKAKEKKVEKTKEKCKEKEPKTQHCIQDKVLRHMAIADGMQSAKAARSLIRGTFYAAEHRPVAVFVMKMSMDLARKSRRKRVLLRDAEMIIALVRAVAKHLETKKA